MDKNISYGLKIIAEGVEDQKNGEEIIDSKIDLNEIAEDLLYLSRQSGDIGKRWCKVQRG